MALTFGEVIEACGVPHVLLPNPRVSRRNRPAPQASGGASLADPDAPFLLVRKWVSVPAGRFRALRAELEAQGAVVFRHGTRRGPRGGVKPTMEVALTANVRPFSREAFGRAVEERRILGIRSERFMGDGYVYMDVLGPPLPDVVDPADYALHHYFVFDPPCRLTDLDLPVGALEWPESADALVDAYWWRYFSEPYARTRPEP